MYSTNESIIKVIFVGAAAVGKTSLLNAFLGKDSIVTKTTISPENSKKTVINSRNIKVNLDLWDTAGQEAYQALAPLYYRDAHVALVCFDYDNRNDIKKWMQRVLDHSADCILILVVTKKDLLSSEQMNELDHIVDNLVNDENNVKMSFVTSAVSKYGIDRLFGFVADCDNEISLRKGSGVVSQKLNQNKIEKKGGCCD